MFWKLAPRESQFSLSISKGGSLKVQQTFTSGATQSKQLLHNRPDENAAMQSTWKVTFVAPHQIYGGDFFAVVFLRSCQLILYIENISKKVNVLELMMISNRRLF